MLASCAEHGFPYPGIRLSGLNGGADDFLIFLQEWFMYSHEDRLRAVLLYIKLGKGGGLTIRQLGHPTRGALRDLYLA
jgi:hypothetical protein